MWYVLWTLAPTRVFDARVNDGWKKFTTSRDAAQARERCGRREPVVSHGRIEQNGQHT